MSKRAITHTLTWAILIAVGCSGGGGSGGCGSGGGCGGCSGCGGSTGCLTPIPGGFPDALRQSEAMSVKVTQAGFTAISQQAPALLGSLLATDGGMGATDGGSSEIALDIPCIGPSTIQSFGNSTLGAELVALVCDTNNSQCMTPVTTPPAGECTATVKIDGLQIVPSQANAPGGPVTLNITVDAEIDTTLIPVSIAGILETVLGNQSACALQCEVQFQTSGLSPPYMPIQVDVTLTDDPTYSDILAINVNIPSFASAVPSGALTAMADPTNCSLGGFTSFSCADLTNATFEPIIIGIVQNDLTPKIQAVVDKYRCEACMTTADCTQATGMPATCSSGLCMLNSGNDACVPNKLGIEGRIIAGSYLASYGAPADAPLDLSAVAGGLTNAGNPSTDVQTGGLQVGLMGGTNDPSMASCVPLAVWVPPAEPTQMDFDAEANVMEPGQNLLGYDVGLSVSDAFMNQALFDAWQAGLLCLNISTSISSDLSSGLFSALLANLDELTHGEDVPMLIGLRPTQAPNIVLGKGTTSTTGGMTTLVDPLITLNIPKVHLDFYAFIEEHYVRLFTLQTDLSVPVGLDFTPAAGGTAIPGTTVGVILGTIAAANTTALNNDMNVDTDANLSGFLPNVIGLVTGPLTSALPSFAVPAFDGLQLEVLGARGSIMSASGPGYEHLALFAGIAPPAMMARRKPTHTSARVIDSYVPERQLADAQPTVTIAAKGDFDIVDEYEFTWRVDGGAWTFWSRSSTLLVDAPILRIPGLHDIEVRSRLAGQPETADPHPAHVEFPVSYAPKVKPAWHPLPKSTWMP